MRSLVGSHRSDFKRSSSLVSRKSAQLGRETLTLNGGQSAHASIHVIRTSHGMNGGTYSVLLDQDSIDESHQVPFYLYDNHDYRPHTAEKMVEGDNFDTITSKFDSRRACRNTCVYMYLYVNGLQIRTSSSTHAFEHVPRSELKSRNWCLHMKVRVYKLHLKRTDLHSASKCSKHNSLASVVADLLFGLFQLEK